MAVDRRSRIPDVNQVRTRLEQWRRRRRGRAPIPDELWAAAVEVAQRDGVNRTAVALGLDAGKLKRQMGAVIASPWKAAPPTFVELVTPATNGSPEYSIEMEGRGGKLRIHSKGGAVADLAALTRALWGLAV